MGAAERRNKDTAMASHLIKTGYPHGRRATAARPNSGGLTAVNKPGSSKNQRRDEAKSLRAERREQAQARAEKSLTEAGRA